MMKDALDFWKAIEGKVRETVKAMSGKNLQCERYDVTTAPNGSTGLIGVKQPFGDEIFIPYAAAVSEADAGDTVLVLWWKSLSNAKAWFMADGPRKGPLPIAEGGTGAADAAGARTNLGVQIEVLTVYDGNDRYVIVLRYGSIIHLHVTLKVAVANGTVTDNISWLGVNPSANVSGYGWFQQTNGYAPVSCMVTTSGDLQFLALVLNEPLAGTFDVYWTI